MYGICTDIISDSAITSSRLLNSTTSLAASLWNTSNAITLAPRPLNNLAVVKPILPAPSIPNFFTEHEWIYNKILILSSIYSVSCMS